METVGRCKGGIDYTVCMLMAPLMTCPSLEEVNMHHGNPSEDHAVHDGREIACTPLLKKRATENRNAQGCWQILRPDLAEILDAESGADPRRTLFN